MAARFPARTIEAAALAALGAAAFLILGSARTPRVEAAQETGDWTPNHLTTPDVSDEVADVPAQDVFVDGDTFKRVFLIGLDREAKPPKGGYGVVVVLPGDNGGPNFTSFARHLHVESVPEGFLTLQMVAPEWKQGQHSTLTWPTKLRSLPEAKFTTEEFVEEALAFVAKQTKLDPKRVFSLSWSSGGPPAYSLSLQKKTPLAGSVIAMSVFREGDLPPLSRAKGYPFYLMQSPEDEVTRFSHAETARDRLGAAKAQIELLSYEGGHAWPQPVYPRVRAALEWVIAKAE